MVGQGDIPALQAAPTTNVPARRPAATGNDRPHSAVYAVSGFLLQDKGKNPGEVKRTWFVEKKSISLPIVRGTSIETELDTTSWNQI